MSLVTATGAARTLVRRSPRIADAARAARHALREGDACFESTAAHGGFARYSYYALSPVATVTARGSRAVLRWADGTQQTSDTLSLLDSLVDGTPRPGGADDVPWCGGLAGYIAYDFGRTIEPRATDTRNDLVLPDVALGVYDAVLVVDHQRGSSDILASGWPHTGDAAAAIAEERLDILERTIERAAHVALPPASPIALQCETRYADYARGIARVLHAIREGDIYQANIAQRFRGVLHAYDPRAAYSHLRVAAPAPYAAAVLTREAHVFSASPELFLERRGDCVITRPIKGTRPRGATPRADAALAAALSGSEKDRAEHVMIVDVERNDLGRFATPGGVHVDEMAALESFASVHHLTSTIRADARRGTQTSDVLRATFPSGSISGAPKLRAMEIIDAVEPVRRGVYTGALGWFAWGGDCQLAMAIRCAVAARGAMHVWVGGGIVADSRADDEYEETLVKGRAVARALGADLDRAVAARGGV